MPRRYLALAGTGFILIDFPKSKQVDLYIANQEGTVQAEFFACAGGSLKALKPIQSVAPNDVVYLKTFTGTDICQVRVTVTSAECLIWRFCYTEQ